MSGTTADISSSSLSLMIHQKYQNGLRKYQSMVSELTDSFPGILPGLSQMELPRLYMATHLTTVVEYIIASRYLMNVAVEVTV